MSDYSMYGSDQPLQTHTILSIFQFGTKNVGIDAPATSYHKIWQRKNKLVTQKSCKSKGGGVNSATTTNKFLPHALGFSASPLLVGVRVAAEEVELWELLEV